MTASINKSAVRTLSDLPSPRGLPLLGNAFQLDLPRLHLVLEAWAEKFGYVFTIGLGPKRIFVCSDPDLLQTVLRERPDRYRRFSSIESVLEEMKVNGVFSVEGEGWRPQRRLVMQALASKHFSSFFPILRDITEPGCLALNREPLSRIGRLRIGYGIDPDKIISPGSNGPSFSGRNLPGECLVAIYLLMHV